MQPKYYGQSAKYRKPTGGGVFDKRVTMFVVLGLIALVFISIAFALINAFTSGPRNDVARLIARESSLQKFIADSKQGIQNDDLRKVMSDGSIFFTSDVITLRAQLLATYGNNEIPVDISSGEADTTSAKKLKDAQLLNTYDKTFYQLLDSKLAATLQIAQTVRDTNTGSLQKAASQAVNNLTEISNKLAAVKL